MCRGNLEKPNNGSSEIAQGKKQIICFTSHLNRPESIEPWTEGLSRISFWDGTIIMHVVGLYFYYQTFLALKIFNKTIL